MDWADFVKKDEASSIFESSTKQLFYSKELYPLIKPADITKIEFSGFDNFVGKDDWIYFRNQLINTVFQFHDLYQLLEGHGSEKPPVKANFRAIIDGILYQIIEDDSHVTRREEMFKHRNAVLSKILVAFLYKVCPPAFKQVLIQQTSKAFAAKDGVAMWTIILLYLEDSNAQSDVATLRKYHTMAQTPGEDSGPYIQRVQMQRDVVESRKYSTEEVACSVIIGGLDPRRYGNFMSTLQITKTTTVDDLAKSLGQFEAAERLNADTHAKSKALKANDSEKEQAKLIKHLTSQIDKLTSFHKQGSKPGDTRTCFNCGEVGHIAPHCTKAKKDKGKESARLAANEANTKKQRIENKKRKRAAAKAAKEADSAKLANVQQDEDDDVEHDSALNVSVKNKSSRKRNRILYCQSAAEILFSLISMFRGLLKGWSDWSVEISISILCILFSTSLVNEKAYMMTVSSNAKRARCAELTVDTCTKFLRMIADSGCTAHMADISPLALEDFVRSVSTIDTAGTETLYSLGYGSFGPLNKILSVKGLSDSLFSIHAACKQGNTAIFTHDSVKIFADSQVTTMGEPIISGGVENKQYVFNIPRDQPLGARERAFVTDVAVPNRFTLWHQRLLHTSNRTLEVMAGKSLVDGLEEAFTKKDAKLHKQCLCSACCVGKMHMKGQRKKPKPLPTGHHLRPGQLVFMDLFQSNVESNGKNNYCLLLVDAKSKRLWQYVMKSKSETIDCIVQWVQDVKSEGTIQLQYWTTMRSDNGGEFISDEVKSYLRREGIRKQTSTPYMHVNAVERQIQTVKDAVRTIINAARQELTTATKLMSGGKRTNPFSFWCEATSTVVYTLNRMPMHRGSSMTRLQAWDGTKPDVSHLRTFGCTVYAKVYDEVTEGTWDNRAFEGIFVGYEESVGGPDTYKVLNLETKHMVNTSNLIFNENLLSKEVRLTLSDEDTTSIPHITLDEILGVLADNDVKLDKAQKEAVEQHIIKKFGIDEEWQPYSLGIVRKGVIPGSVLNPIMQEVSTH